jgi:hypothetical protein
MIINDVMNAVMDDVMDAIIRVRAIDFLRISLSSIGSVWISYNRMLARA